MMGENNSDSNLVVDSIKFIKQAIENYLNLKIPS